MAVDIKWTPKIVTKAAAVQIERRMAKAMLTLAGIAQRKISVGQPTRRPKNKEGEASGPVYGLEPSVAPNPPKVVTGALRKSIVHEVVVEPFAIVGRVGSNLVYARRLELGFSGADSLGRNVNQEARPYLRPSLTENLPRLLKFLADRK